MLSKSFSKRKVVLPVLLLIPVVAICAAVFNQAIILQTKDEPTKVLKLFLTADGDFKHLGESITNDELKSILIQEKFTSAHIDIAAGVSEELLEKNSSPFTEYNELSGKEFPLLIDITERNDLFSIPNKPKKEDIKQWQNEQLFTIYLDHKKIRNSDVLKYSLKEFASYVIGDWTNEVYRVDIWTNSYWKEQKVLESKTRFGQLKETYADKFIEGAQRNGEKPLVIEIKNDTIKINGKVSTLETFQKDVDKATKDWEETDYTDPIRTYMFKGNSEEFLRKIEIEYAKTHISKANDGAKLVPPPPPAPVAPEAPMPPPPVKHLKKMNELGGLFFYETKSISFDQALELVKTNKNLNIRTPYPYSNPPKTYLSGVTKD